MEKSEINCKPKIVNYFVECENVNYSYNCEYCDKCECDYWVKWHNE